MQRRSCHFLAARPIASLGPSSVRRPLFPAPAFVFRLISVAFRVSGDGTENSLLQQRAERTVIGCLQPTTRTPGTTAELAGKRIDSPAEPFGCSGLPTYRNPCWLTAGDPELVCDTTFLVVAPGRRVVVRLASGGRRYPYRLLRRPAGPACRRGRSALRCSC